MADGTTESVWEYPRPPRLEPTRRRLRVEHAGEIVAETTRGWRVLETSHPPVYYVPQEDIRMEWMRRSARRGSFCEFKGAAGYWTLEVPGAEAVEDVAWSYRQPSPGFEAIKDCLAFYAGRVDACFVDRERVLPQPGEFYGGWITADVTGPFKGAPGTLGW
jgi:uncharacterized protein (DUF427 family)